MQHPRNVDRRSKHATVRKWMGVGSSLCLLMLLVVGSAVAQEEDSGQEAAGAPSLADAGAAAQRDSTDHEGGTDSQQSPSQFQNELVAVDLPFFMKYENEPKIGMRANVRQIQTYTDYWTKLTMKGASSLTSTSSWSWDDFRQQEKTSQKRKETLSYNTAAMWPAVLTINGSWDWNEDETLNNANLTNIAKRDFKLLDMKLAKTKYRMGGFETDMTGLAGLKDQKSVNQGIHNDFTEASVGAAVKTRYKIRRGLSVSARVFGRKLGGDRSLGESTSPSSAVQDSIGLRINFDRSFASGWFEMTRGRFEEEFLDFNRNSSGLIDTTDVDDADKIVEEMKTQDASILEFQSLSRRGAFGLKAKGTHKTSDLVYQASGLGRTERSDDSADISLFRASRRDSIAVTYGYGWKWDDQRIRGATVNRGRQYSKDRSLDLYWNHTFFEATETTLKVQQSLTQSIAQNQFNQNDRDRVRQDITFGVKRQWEEGFLADLLFAYKSAEDISIHKTRSSNNNIKDSYEIAPGYDWDLARWLKLKQNFRLYIQYTDYTFSDLEAVNKDDDYNKRGNMNTRVTIRPTRRFTLVVKHDYNRRFNATRTRVDATGNSFYRTDDRQTTSRIDLSAKMEVADGITLEGATYNRLDEKERLGTTTTVTDNRAGEVWTGVKIVRKFGSKTNQFDVSCLVKKFNAYGPAVTKTSDDYWEADVWVKWKF